ncbi:MAG: hypothetical protein Q7J21_03590 [Rugosibacter sp.]|nr:hypothetical protein [Rugosibacter sp.]
MQKVTLCAIAVQHMRACRRIASADFLRSFLEIPVIAGLKSRLNTAGTLVAL